MDQIRCSSSRRLLAAALLWSMPIAGCNWGRPARLVPPALDPATSAAAAIEQLDQNGDGQLSESECKGTSALGARFDRYDVSPADGQLSADEIAARLQAMLDSRIGLMPCHCQVTWNNRPLEQARVELIPEPFLAVYLAPAEGITSSRGVARPEIPDAEPGTPGVNFGLYRVRITHPSLEIPAKYNEQTELAIEISPLERDGDSAVFALKGSR